MSAVRARTMRCTALFANELRVVWREPGAIVTILLLPIALMTFLQPSAEAMLEADGRVGTNGSEQSVPGTAVMFGLFAVGIVGTSFVRERSWRTWSRLRSSPARPADIMTGKIVPLFGVIVAQQLLLFSVGSAILGLRPIGDARATAVLVTVVAVAFAAFVVALGLLLSTVARTISRLVLMQGAATLIVGGFGGALTPMAFLPGWVQRIGAWLPSHWAIEGYGSAILRPDQPAEVAPRVLAILGTAAVLTVLAAARFRFEEESYV